MKELYEGTPFKERLIRVPHDAMAPLYTFRTNGNYFVRKNSIELDKKDHQPLINDIKMATVMFEEFERDYGIPVVPFDTVVGSSGKDATVYMVADKIDGNRLPIAKIREEEAKNFFSSLLNYYTDKYKHGGFFVADLNVNDFMYGSTGRNPTKRIYLVDLDPFYGCFDNLNPGEINEYFSASLEFLNDLLNILEERSTSDLSKLRDGYIQFLREIKDTLHPKDRVNVESVLNSAEKLTTEGMVRG